MRGALSGKLAARLSALAAALVVFGGAMFGFAVDAWAAGALVVSPSTGLADGQSVTVSGSGLSASSTGAIVECSTATLQPTVAVLGNKIPVSCTNPLAAIRTTDGSGNLSSSSFTVHTGVVGPPASGTDSVGNPAATDAANFPCPPTASQAAAGATCTVSFGDQAGDQASQAITFASSGSTTTGPTTTGPTTTVSPTTTPACSPRPNSVTAAGATLTVDPATCLDSGSSVTVSGSGLGASSPGGLVECSGAPGQPTIPVAGNQVPVSCFNPLDHLATTDASGNLAPTPLSIVVGTTGPPATGPDSSGVSAATDAAKFPCPPTATQQAAGVTCVVSFGDLAGKQVSVPISFVPGAQPSPPTAATPTTAAAPTTGAGGTVTATATAAGPTGTTSAPGQLAFTGNSAALIWLAAAGAAMVLAGSYVLVATRLGARATRAAKRAG